MATPSAPSTARAPMKPDLAAPVDADDHRRGVAGGRQLVVYGDFECPYTAAAMRDIGRLLEDGAAFEVVFRHFPLREIHPHAQAAAEAAEAAARQDRFWRCTTCSSATRCGSGRPTCGGTRSDSVWTSGRFRGGRVGSRHQGSGRAGRGEWRTERRRRHAEPLHRRAPLPGTPRYRQPAWATP